MRKGTDARRGKVAGNGEGRRRSDIRSLDGEIIKSSSTTNDFTCARHNHSTCSWNKCPGSTFSPIAAYRCHEGAIIKGSRAADAHVTTHSNVIASGCAQGRAIAATERKISGNREWTGRHSHNSRPCGSVQDK